jgi:hypothetical protein
VGISRTLAGGADHGQTHEGQIERDDMASPANFRARDISEGGGRSSTGLA